MSTYSINRPINKAIHQAIYGPPAAYTAGAGGMTTADMPVAVYIGNPIHRAPGAVSIGSTEVSAPLTTSEVITVAADVNLVTTPSGTTGSDLVNDTLCWQGGEDLYMDSGVTLTPASNSYKWSFKFTLDPDIRDKNVSGSAYILYAGQRTGSEADRMVQFWYNMSAGGVALLQIFSQSSGGTTSSTVSTGDLAAYVNDPEHIFEVEVSWNHTTRTATAHFVNGENADISSTANAGNWNLMGDYVFGCSGATGQTSPVTHSGLLFDIVMETDSVVTNSWTGQLSGSGNDTWSDLVGANDMTLFEASGSTKAIWDASISSCYPIPSNISTWDAAGTVDTIDFVVPSGGTAPNLLDSDGNATGVSFDGVSDVLVSPDVGDVVDIAGKSSARISIIGNFKRRTAKRRALAKKTASGGGWEISRQATSNMWVVTLYKSDGTVHSEYTVNKKTDYGTILGSALTIEIDASNTSSATVTAATLDGVDVTSDIVEDTAPNGTYADATSGEDITLGGDGTNGVEGEITGMAIDVDGLVTADTYHTAIQADLGIADYVDVDAAVGTIESANAIGIYSLYRREEFYAGPLARVDNGISETDVYSIAEMETHFAASGATEQRLAIWYDQSALGVHLGPYGGLVANRPKLTSSVYATGASSSTASREIVGGVEWAVKIDSSAMGLTAITQPTGYAPKVASFVLRPGSTVDGGDGHNTLWWDGAAHQFWSGIMLNPGDNTQRIRLTDPTVDTYDFATQANMWLNGTSNNRTYTSNQYYTWFSWIGTATSAKNYNNGVEFFNNNIGGREYFGLCAEMLVYSADLVSASALATDHTTVYGPWMGVGDTGPYA